mmetsp:Transcript_14381/g.23741  ORF Transcript_14381/g.23741 Transcript_14381/m.23741 type:complete len:439 (+) Transcript_14381:137-1453(+)
MTNTHNSSSSSSSSSYKKNMRRRTMQAIIGAAALVVSAQAFSLPASQVTRTSSRGMLSSRTSAVSTALSVSLDQAEKQEFDLQLGRALDALKTDYPNILKQSPDFSVYDPNLMVVDPSGFTLNGIRNYKQAFHLVHGIVNVFYCPEKSLLTFRMVYDCARNNIRVSWNAEVVPKMIFGGDRSMLHVDGISVYELNSAGNIVQHRVEHLMINDMPVETERGIFHALRSECVDSDCGNVPVFFEPSSFANDHNIVARFQAPIMGSGTKSLFAEDGPSSSTTLQALSTSSAGGTESSGSNNDYPGLDADAMDRKNKTRKKFGLKELTVEEYLEVEAQVQEMSAKETTKQQQYSIDASAELQNEKKGSLLNNLFGRTFDDSCESNYDCDRPQICCNFGFKKMCCSSGAMVGQSAAQPQPLRVPLNRVAKDEGYNMPKNKNGW